MYIIYIHYILLYLLLYQYHYRFRLVNSKIIRDP